MNKLTEQAVREMSLLWEKWERAEEQNNEDKISRIEAVMEAKLFNWVWDGLDKRTIQRESYELHKANKKDGVLN
jgi:hypothetical protein